MIPKRMEAFLKERLPERTWKNRLVRENGQCYMEFSSVDIDRLARLGIEVDSLGPKMVVCMWEDESPLEIGRICLVTLKVTLELTLQEPLGHLLSRLLLEVALVGKATRGVLQERLDEGPEAHGFPADVGVK